MTLEIVHPPVPALGASAPQASLAGASDDEIVDIREDGGMMDADPGWVTVASAAEKAGVSTSTVRSWYRSGQLATQRRDGERGAFLVPLDDVLQLAAAADETGEAIADSVIDINAGYWAAETETAREAQHAAEAAVEEANAEVRRLSADLEDARNQIEAARVQLSGVREEASNFERLATQRSEELRLVRDQLAEAEAGADVLRDTIASLEADLAETRRSATFGSITSKSWVDEAPDGYRGPLRPQGSLPDAAWTFDEVNEGDEVDAVGSVDPFVEADEALTDAAEAPAPAPSAVAIPVSDGADDVLPAPPGKGRRSRR